MAADEVSKDKGASRSCCSILIVHETDEALVHAMTLCERIMAGMWASADIDVDQWPFAVLSNPTDSEQSATRAALADIVVIAAAGEGEFPPDFTEWTQRWVGQRQHHEGALVGLFAPGTGKEGGAASRDVQLHHIALRAGMDYLNHLPDTPARPIPDLMEWCAERAEKHTGTLDQIIQIDPKF